MPRQGSIDLDSADRPFDNIINFRDVGRTINHFCGTPYVGACHVNPPPKRSVSDTQTRILKEGVLFRSARVNSILCGQQSKQSLRILWKTDRDRLYSSTMPQNEINAD